MNVSIRWQVAFVVMLVSTVSLAAGSAVAFVDGQERLTEERDAAARSIEQQVAADLATLYFLAQGRLLALESALGDNTDDAAFGEGVAGLGVLEGDLVVVAWYQSGQPLYVRPPGASPEGIIVRTDTAVVRGELADSAIDSMLRRGEATLGVGSTVMWLPQGDGAAVDGIGGVVRATPPPRTSADMQAGLLAASGTGIIVAAGTFLGGLVAASVLVRPLQHLRRTADAVASGKTIEGPFRGPKEFRELDQQLRSAAERVTEEREASTRLQQELDTEVQRRGTQLESRDAALAALFQGISHDVKGPLISAASLMGRLDRNIDEEERKLVLERCRESLRIVGHAVEQMVAFSRALRPADLHDGPVDDILRSCVATAQRAALGMGRHVNSTGGRMLARADPSRLESAVSALLDNAYRHGGHVEVSWFGEGQPTIIIEDDGVGIAYDVARLVEPYMLRSDSPGAMAGMGLAIAHRMITGMGGRLDIKTGRSGTVCTITLLEAEE